MCAPPAVPWQCFRRQTAAANSTIRKGSAAGPTRWRGASMPAVGLGRVGWPPVGFGARQQARRGPQAYGHLAFGAAVAPAPSNPPCARATGREQDSCAHTAYAAFFRRDQTVPVWHLALASALALCSVLSPPPPPHLPLSPLPPPPALLISPDASRSSTSPTPAPPAP